MRPLAWSLATGLCASRFHAFGRPLSAGAEGAEARSVGNGD